MERCLLGEPELKRKEYMKKMCKVCLPALKGPGVMVQYNVRTLALRIFSWPLELFSRVTKSVPEISFLERHASEYLRKLAGNAFLNCSAIPHQKISNVFMSINI